jgi:hypothetical protein
MARLRILALGLMTALALLVVPVLATRASAETVDLSCKNTAGQVFWYVSVDTSASIASIWTAGSARGSAFTDPATITANQATWKHFASTDYAVRGDARNSDSFTFTLDRNTGALNEDDVSVRPTMAGSHDYISSYICEKAARLF